MLDSVALCRVVSATAAWSCRIVFVRAFALRDYGCRTLEPSNFSLAIPLSCACGLNFFYRALTSPIITAGLRACRRMVSNVDRNLVVLHAEEKYKIAIYSSPVLEMIT
eukprot:IDg4176t1